MFVMSREDALKENIFFHTKLIWLDLSFQNNLQHVKLVCEAVESQNNRYPLPLYTTPI